MSNKVLPKNFLGSTGQGECVVDVPSAISLDHSLDQIFCFARSKDASDIHLSVDTPITFRIYGTLVAQCENFLSIKKMESLITEILNQEQLQIFEDGGDLEFVYVVEGSGRFRVTIAKQRFGWDLTARLVPLSIRSFEDSGMPPSCRELTKWAQGLILITGPVGCGKTSTISTLIDMINQDRDEHIITIEDPIEVVFDMKECQITQRQIDLHTFSQNNALKGALRQDPDIIVVGELKDLNTIKLAVTAAETGHLVLATMNTNDAVQTVGTLIDSFPPDDRSVIQNMISESLRGVISQQIIPRADGKGLVPCYEVLVVNIAIANLIREGKLEQLGNMVVLGKADGMVDFDESLKKLLNAGFISQEEALGRAKNKTTFNSQE